MARPEGRYQVRVHVANYSGFALGSWWGETFGMGHEIMLR